MRTIIPALLALLVLLAVGCHNAKPAVVEAPPPPPAVEAPPSVVRGNNAQEQLQRRAGADPDALAARIKAVDQAHPDSLFFSMSRTPCFGQCPTYQVQVLGDGRATYVGSGNVARLGSFSGKLSQAQMLALLAEAQEQGFFKMDAEYDEPVTDLPSTFITFQAFGMRKQVKGRVGMPSGLRALRDHAEALLDEVQWTPQEPAKP